MTAIVAWMQSRPELSLSIATDSRFSGEAAQGLISKVATIPHLNAAVAVQGLAAMLPSMVHLLCQKAPTFDLAMAAFATCAREAHATILDTQPGTEFVAVLAGFDGRGNRRLAVVATHEVFGFGAYQTREGSTFVALPADAGIVAAMGLPDDTDDIKPADAVRFIRAQRDGDIVGLDGRDLRDVIGGPVVWTGIYADRIEQRVVGAV